MEWPTLIVERARGAGRAAARTETCLLPTGATSVRATVLGNPPLSASAIRQRQTLVAAIGAYASTLAAVAEGSGAEVVSASLIYSKSRAVAFRKAASVHAAGDLFVADESSQFANAIARIDRAGPKDALAQQLARAGTLARRLNTIVATDVARQRGESIDATTLAYETWLAGVRWPAGLAATRRAAVLLRTGNSSARFRGSYATIEREQHPIRAAYAFALEWMRCDSANPGSVLSAMATLQDAEMRLLAGSREAGETMQVALARDRLEQVCEHFGSASSAFVSSSRTPPSDGGSP